MKKSHIIIAIIVAAAIVYSLLYYRRKKKMGGATAQVPAINNNDGTITVPDATAAQAIVANGLGTIVGTSAAGTVVQPTSAAQITPVSTGGGVAPTGAGAPVVITVPAVTPTPGDPGTGGAAAIAPSLVMPSGYNAGGTIAASHAAALGLLPHSLTAPTTTIPVNSQILTPGGMGSLTHIGNIGTFGTNTIVSVPLKATTMKVTNVAQVRGGYKSI